MTLSDTELQRLLSDVTFGRFIRYKNGKRKQISECWQRGKDSLIYTRVTLDNGNSIAAHRLSYQVFNHVIIPSGTLVCHECDTPNCIYPDHLFAGTTSDNVRDALNKGRMKAPTVYRRKPLTFVGDFGKGY